MIAAVSIFIFAEGMWTVVMALQVIALADDPAALSLVAACLAGDAGLHPGRRDRGRPGVPARHHHHRRAINLVAVGAVAALGMVGSLRFVAHGGGLGRARRVGVLLPGLQRLPRILPPQNLLAANGIEG